MEACNGCSGISYHEPPHKNLPGPETLQSGAGFLGFARDDRFLGTCSMRLPYCGNPPLPKRTRSFSVPISCPLASARQLSSLI